jgi:hypothetical protein
MLLLFIINNLVTNMGSFPTVKETSKKLFLTTKHLLLQLFFALGSILMLLGVLGVDKKLNKFLDTIINPKFFETLKANKFMFEIAIAIFAVLFSYYIVKAIWNAIHFKDIRMNVYPGPNADTLKWYQKIDCNYERGNLLHKSRQGFMIPIAYCLSKDSISYKGLSAISQSIVHSAIGCIFAVLITDLVQTFKGAKPIFNILPEFLTQSDIGLKVFAAIVLAFAALFVANTIIDIVNSVNISDTVDNLVNTSRSRDYYRNNVSPDSQSGNNTIIQRRVNNVTPELRLRNDIIIQHVEEILFIALPQMFCEKFFCNDKADPNQNIEIDKPYTRNEQNFQYE